MSSALLICNFCCTAYQVGLIFYTGYQRSKLGDEISFRGGSTLILSRKLHLKSALITDKKQSHSRLAQYRVCTDFHTSEGNQLICPGHFSFTCRNSMQERSGDGSGCSLTVFNVHWYLCSLSDSMSLSLCVVFFPNSAGDPPRWHCATWSGKKFVIVCLSFCLSKYLIRD